jgi:hypothetical protein
LSAHSDQRMMLLGVDIEVHLLSTALKLIDDEPVLAPQDRESLAVQLGEMRLEVRIVTVNGPAGRDS